MVHEMTDYLFANLEQPSKRVIIHGSSFYKAVRGLLDYYGNHRLVKTPSKDHFRITKAKKVRKSKTTKSGRTEYYDDFEEYQVYEFECISYQEAARKALDYVKWGVYDI